MRRLVYLTENIFDSTQMNISIQKARLGEVLKKFKSLFIQQVFGIIDNCISFCEEMSDRSVFEL